MITEYDVKPGTYTIRVTDVDILNGKRGDATCCPIALATRRALDLLEVEVDGSRFRIGSVEGWFEPTPDIDEFIAKFDAGEQTLAPFTVKLVIAWREYDSD